MKRQTHSRRDVMIGAAAFAVAPSSSTYAGSTPKLHEVKITSFVFEPAIVTARPGDTIRWTNFDLAPHTATADAFGWDTGELTQGASAEISVTDDMELSYFCAFHPHMKGKIVLG